MRVLTVAVLLAFCCLNQARGDNWPQWRGPQGTGIAQERQAPLEWAKDQNIRWRVKLPGPGNSTPIVWGDKVIVTCASKDGRERGTYCFDRHSGKEIWKQVVPYAAEEITHETNPVCAGSPATDGERIVVWHGSAGLFCYDMAGQLMWQKDLGKFEHIWGVGSSPILYEDLVILNAGPGLHVFVAAYNKQTGEEVWRHEYESMKSEKLDEFRGSWSTPVVYKDGKRDVLLLALPERLRAVEPRTGKELWSCGGASKLFYTSPLISQDIVIAMCGYMGPAFAVRGGGRGDVTESHRLWHQTMKNPQRVGSGVVVDGKIYILNENSVVWCIDAASGEIHWQHRLGGGPSWCSAVYAAGRIYLANTAGDVFVITPDVTKCNVLAKNSLGELMRASPAFSNGDIFLRTYDALYCVSAMPASK